MPTSGYFPSTYFPPSYFGPLGATAIAPPGAGSPMSAYRDRDAFAAILSTLASTAEFAEVVFPGPLDATPVAADRTPLAVVVPVQWVEQPDASSPAIVRHVNYSLVLVARAVDPRCRFEALDRLSSIAQNAIQSSTLGGSCIASQTHLRRGVLDPDSRTPELRVALDGQFAYVVPSANGHDATH